MILLFNIIRESSLSMVARKRYCYFNIFATIRTILNSIEGSFVYVIVASCGILCMVCICWRGCKAQGFVAQTAISWDTECVMRRTLYVIKELHSHALIDMPRSMFSPFVVCKNFRSTSCCRNPTARNSCFNSRRLVARSYPVVRPR